MSPAVTRDSSPKCLEVTREDINIFLQSSVPSSSSFHVIDLWASSLAGFEALALAGPSPQCHSAHPLQQVGVGTRELVDRPITKSAEMGQSFLWKSASGLHRGALVGFQGWEGSFSVFFNPSVFPLVGNDTSTRVLRALSFALPFPWPTHHLVLSTHLILELQSLPVFPSHLGHSYHHHLPG